MLFVEIKKFTAFNKCFKNTEVNTFITPLTFTKKSRIFICRADYINFFLLYASSTAPLEIIEEFSGTKRYQNLNILSSIE